MNWNFTNSGRVIIILMFVTTAFMGLVSADIEPNNSPTTSELVGSGTYLGSIGITDYADWYRVENIGDREVKITGTMKSGGIEQYISIVSCDQYGNEDGQTEIYIGSHLKSDYCHWKDQGTSDTMYLKVEGQGDYELKIEMDKDEKSQKFKITPVFTCFLIGFLILGALFTIIGILFGYSKLINKNPLDIIFCKSYLNIIIITGNIIMIGPIIGSTTISTR